MMIAGIVGYALEFLIQWVVLFGALWIMCRVQKLDSNFVALAILAAVAAGLELLLNRFLSFYISTPIVCLLLYVGVWRISFGDAKNVIITVAAGGALLLLLNMFLLTWMLGSMRPSADDEDMKQLVAELQKRERAAAAKAAVSAAPPEAPPSTNQAAVQPAPLAEKPSTNAPAVAATARTNAPAVAAGTNAARRNPPGARRPRPAAAKTPPAPAPEEAPAMSTGTNSVFHAIVQKFSLKGITASGANSTALVHTGVRNYTIAAGETVSMRTTRGTIMVKCLSINTDEVVLDVAGGRISLSLEQ